MKLRPYQELARDFLRAQPRAGLFLDMGMGKTASVLSALESRHLPALVIAPKRVAEHTWPEEHALWRPDLELRLVAGDPTRRRAALSASQADLTVIGRDNATEAAALAVKGTVSYRTLILDESSGYKTKSSVRWREARKLAIRAKHCWELTGTPSPNGYLDLWAQIFLLDQGERLGTRLTDYRARYFVPNVVLPSGVVASWRIRPESEDRIRAKIADICLAMENEADEPPIYNPVVVDLPPAVRAKYDEFKRELVVSFELLGGTVHSAANAAVLNGRLSQITAGFLYSDDGDGKYDELHDEKIKALREIVEGTGSPVLVAYAFKPERDRLRQAFPEARMLDDPGAYDAWNRGEVPMLLAHPASAGHGLNLQHGGHTMVWTTTTWSLELWEQMNARLARPGQKHPVIVHTLEARNSIDQVMRRRLVEKASVQDALMEYLGSPM